MVILATSIRGCFRTTLRRAVATCVTTFYVQSHKAGVASKILSQIGRNNKVFG